MKPGMRKLASLTAVLVLGSAATPFGTVSAGTIEISGYSYWVSYGDRVSKNNVVNFAESGISDNTPYRQTPWRAGGAVFSTIENYAVDWYFNGAEADDNNIFSSGALSFMEHNENNNWNPGNDPGYQSLFTTTGSGAGEAIDFSVQDQGKGGVSNGGFNPYPFSTSHGSRHYSWNAPASLIFSYAVPVADGWELTLDPTDWFVFAFNDPGSGDHDHDDLIGLAYVRPVPIPGALPLMGTVIGGSFLLRRLRRSRRKTTSATVAA